MCGTHFAKEHKTQSPKLHQDTYNVSLISLEQWMKFNVRGRPYFCFLKLFFFVTRGGLYDEIWPEHKGNSDGFRNGLGNILIPTLVTITSKSQYFLVLARLPCNISEYWLVELPIFICIF